MKWNKRGNEGSNFITCILFDMSIRAKYKLVTILFVFNSVLPLRAAETNDFSPIFQNIGLEEGLSNYHVTSICQDGMGYLWIGTVRGLNRYDGTTFKQYFFSPDHPVDGLPYDFIDHLEYCNNHIFVLTREGSAVLNQETDEWTFLHIPDYDVEILDSQDRPRVSKTNILVWQDRIFINSNNRLFEYDFNESTFISPGFLIPGKVSSFIKSDDHFLWIFSDDQKKVYRCDLTSHTILQLDLDHFDIPWISFAKIINHQLIAITDKEIFSLELSDKKDVINKPVSLFKSSKRNHYSIIEQWDKHTALISSSAIGINIYDTGTGDGNHLEGIHSPFSENLIPTIFKDRDGNLWIGTLSKGLYVYYKRQPGFNYDAGLNEITAGEFISSIIFNPYEGELLMGSRTSGLLSDKSGEKKIVNDRIKPFGLMSKKLMVDSRNQIWIAGFGNEEPLIYDQVNDQIIHLENEETFRQIGYISEYDGEVHLTSRIDGIYIYNLEGRLQRILARAVKGINHLLHLEKDILFCSELSGLYRYDRNTEEITHITLHQGGRELEWNGAICMKQESDSVIWIGTRSWGLIRANLNNYEGTKYTSSDGLPCNDITAIEIDKNGYLWLSTSYGISCMYEDGKFNNFSTYEGLGNLQFHRLSSYFSDDGIIYFGRNDGLSYFNPNEIEINMKMEQKPILEGLNVQNIEVHSNDETNILNHSLPFTSQIELTHRFTDFSIDFTTTEFLALKHIEYAYRLENWDDNWRVVNDQQNASYSNMPPGRYIFEVKARRGSGIWSDVSALQIRIKPAPWKTWWAYLFYFSVLTGLVTLFFRLRFRNMMALRNLEIEQNEHRRETEINDMKIRFFTNISHELRTPLSMVYDLTSMNPQDLYKKDELTHFLAHVKINIGRLKRLVEQLLVFRKLEEDTLSIEIRPTNLQHTLNSIVSNIGYYARQRNINLFYEYNLGGEHYAIDGDKIEKILYNLLHNALKYTREDGTIMIIADHVSGKDMEKVFSPPSEEINGQQDYIMFEITDSGIGISDHDLPHIFERYFKASGKSDYSSTGIGLNFVKRLVDLQNGLIKAESTLGKGTTFFIALPLFDVEDRGETEEDMVQVPDWEKEFDLQPFSIDLPEEFREKKILILEDDIALNTYLKKNFESHLKVYTAYNSDEALAVVKNVFPDIIISDVMMREEDEGLTFCETIKNDSLYSHIPIILLTARSDDVQIKEGFMKGADIYVTKPFSLQLLTSQIISLLKNRTRLQQHLFKGELDQDAVKRDYNTQDLTFIKKVNTIIETNYNNSKFNVVELSKDMAINRTGFYQKFTQITKLSPSNYLRKYRIEKAVQLLYENKISVVSIGDEVGFSSRGGFFNAFKKEKGMTPSEFLKKAATAN